MQSSHSLLAVLQPRNVFPKELEAILLKCNLQERWCFYPSVSMGGYEPNFNKHQLANTDGLYTLINLPLVLFSMSFPQARPTALSSLAFCLRRVEFNISHLLQRFWIKSSLTILLHQVQFLFDTVRNPHPVLPSYIFSLFYIINHFIFYIILLCICLLCIVV